MNKLKTLPILGFFIRYPLIIVFAAGFLGLTLWDDLFQHVGAPLYAPALVFLALVLALLGRHFFYRSTIDADAASGDFTRFWAELSPRERVDRALFVFAVFFLGACYVVASVAK